MIDFDIIEIGYKSHNEKRINDNCILGSICTILDKNRKLWCSNIGFSNLSKTKTIDENTVFRIASMTKPITGCAFLQQVEKGKIGLDDPICKWLPEYKNMKVAVDIKDNNIISTEDAIIQITPRMLLSHSAGLGCGKTYEIQDIAILKEKSLEKSVKNYAETVLEFQPGKSQNYSGVWGFDVIAQLIEILTDMPYDEYIKKNIFEPLNMTDTTYYPSDEQVLRETDFVTRTDTGLIPYALSAKAGFLGFGDGYVGGGAGLFSTIKDYGNFATMLLRNGEFDGRKILNQDSISMMATPQIPNNIQGITSYFNWGLGVRVCPKQDMKIQPLPDGSFGWSGAFGTHFWIDKKNNIACVYMMNLSNAGGSGEPAAREFEIDVMTGIKNKRLVL